VNADASAFLVADTLRLARKGTEGGFAGALRGAELALLDSAGHDVPAEIAHPFYWAPFALIGEGGSAAATSAEAQRSATTAGQAGL
jgi:CHAT domain-containing protein